MTVYVTSDELLDLEHARLTLRRAHGLAVDRGRLVREAIALVLADFEAQRRRQRARPAADRGMTHPHARGRSHGSAAERERDPGVRGAPGQLRGPVRPAAQPDRQAQARHHRGRAVEGHRRVHRPREGSAARSWDLEQTTSFLLVASTLLDLKAARLLPQGDVEDEEDLALLEARDLLFARLHAVPRVQAGRRRPREAAGRRVAAAPARRSGLEERFATLLPEVLIGIGLEQFAGLAAKAMEPKPVLEVSLQHIHAAKVSVREQAALVVDRLRRSGTMTFRALCGDSPDTLTTVARFLSLLELFREGAVAFDQVTPLGELTRALDRRRRRRDRDHRRVRRGATRSDRAADATRRARPEPTRPTTT